MKNLALITACFLITLNSFSQNNPPIAVNDTFYVNFNDSVSLLAPSVPVYANDSDPDGNNIFIDTALYYGIGYFSFNTVLITSTTSFVRFNYKPPLNFWGLDSVQYILRDDGIPVMYDTAMIYFKVKHQEFQQLDLNNINARLGLYGLFQDVPNSTASFEVPKGSGLNTFYAANLWIAGKNQDSIYANCETFGSLMASYNSFSSFYSISGPIMDSAYYQEYDFKWDRLWKISNLDIIYHQNNWSSGGYQPIEVIANWPAHGDTSKGQAYYLAPFVDNNGDGIYNPYDGDYPKIKGQQAVYFIYNDYQFSAAQSGGPALNCETHYMAYAYNCPSDSAINNTIFLDYTIYNRSNLTYDSTYIGMWTDMDIGGVNDDAIGCDVDRSTFYTYNADSVDENASAYGYGAYPPAQGVTFLKGAKQDNDGMDNNFGINTNETINGLGFGDAITDNEHWGMEYFLPYVTGNPQSNIDYYHYLMGRSLNNIPITYSPSGDTTKYFSPDSSDTYWYGTGGILQPSGSVTGGGTYPSDKRSIGSTGPFTFYPDSSIEITLALVFGRDYQTTGNQAGVVVMQERIDSIRSYYLTDFVSVCGGTLGIDNKKDIIEPSLTVYPNPFNNELTVNYEPKNNTAKLEVYNLIGEKIASQIITKNISTINLSNLVGGIYFLRVTDGSTFLTQKIIKQ